MPGAKEARAALERVRMEREAALQQASDSEDSAANSGRSSSSSSSDEDEDGRGGRSGRTYHEDMTNGDEFKMYLDLLDEQAERAWSADLVVDPEQYDSFDAAHHPFFGAEVGLRRSVRSVARGRARRDMIELQRREAEILRLEQEAAKREGTAQSARQKVISHKLMSAHGGSPSSSKKSRGDAAAQSRKEAQAAEAKKRLTDYMARAKKIKAKRKSLKADSRKPRGRQKYGGQNFVA